jgi:Pilus formation protein N terminal region
MKPGWVRALAVATVLLVAAVGGAEEPKRQPPEAPAARQITVTVNGTVRLQMTGKKLIKTVLNERPDVARVSAVMDDPTSVLVTGLSPGSTRITLIAADGAEEVCDAGKRR